MKKLILSVLLLFVGINAYGRSYQDVIDRVRLRIRDTGPQDSQFYSNDDIVNAINVIEEEIVEYTEPYQFRGNYKTTTTAKKELYDLPDDLLGTPLRVGYYITSSTGNFERLEYTTIPKLDKEYTNWEDTSPGLPDRYYLDGNQIGLYPPPSTQYSTDSWKCMKVDYLSDPTDVSTSTLSNTVFDGRSSLSPYSKILTLGVISELAGQGIKGYYNLLQNMRNSIRERQEIFNNEGTIYNQ